MEAEALAGRHGRKGPHEEEEEEEEGEEEEGGGGGGVFPLHPLILYRLRSDSVHSQYAG